MTTLKELFMSRACKIGLTIMLIASMVPVAALSAMPAFAENTAAEEISDANANAASEAANEAAPDDAGAEPEANSSEAAGATPSDGDAISERSAYAADSETAAAAKSDDEAPATDEADTTGTTTDLQIDSLETAVEEPFSLFAPFRLLFGAAASGFTAPLASGNHTDWIDRLDLSEAPYGRNFYDILVEASDNDGTADWLIDYGAPNVLNRANAKVGNVYRSPTNSNVIGILAAIVSGNEETTSSSLTPTETKVREYVTEIYGAFDRDYPTSFWRDVKFGTVFWRPNDNSGRTYCLFVLKTSDMDIRAKGYQSADSIKQTIEAVNADVKKIKDAYAASDLAKNDSDYSRVKFYNQWICENNEYNTSFGVDPNLQANNPDVWSAVSALDGRTGATGPVCEGFSRAMKLLCDSDGIGCVLTDGYAPGAGPHMWNYVRIGSDWYGLDTTWNTTEKSPDRYFLLGSDTFLKRHPATNQFVADGTAFTNGPELSASAYDPNSVTFAGVITSSDSFSYGDVFALGCNSTTPGEVEYAVSGPAEIIAAEDAQDLPAQAAALGAGDKISITGLGDITVTVTLTPSADPQKKLTDTITVKGVPRPLKVTGTELTERVYDGTTDAEVAAVGRLVSARDLSYAGVGVLEADNGKVSASAKTASYDSKSAGTAKTGSAAYELSGDAETLKLYTLDGNETDATATGAITKRPVTAFFALSSTRMLMDETAPTGRVRYEAFDAEAHRGLVAGDDLDPAGTVIELSGMPDPLAAGTYEITWAKPNDYVLEAINKLPAAADYDVALAEGADDEPVELEVADLSSTVVTPAEGVSGSMLYRVEMRVDGINNDTVKKLADSGFTSLDDIAKKLVGALAAQTDDLDGDRMALYDMTLYVQDDKGAWQPAAKDNFPSDGIRVTLEYPEGSDAEKNSFYIAHMFTEEVTSGGKTHQPGEVESPQATNGDDGLSFTLMGFSPVYVAWDDTPPTATADGAGTGNGNGNGALGTAVGGTASGSGSQAGTSQTGMSTAASGNASGAGLGTTGDSVLVIAVVAAVVIVCVALIAFLLVRRKKDKRP